MKLTLEKQIPILFTIAIFLLIIVVFLAFRSLDSLEESLKLEKHTQEVLLQLDETLILMVNAETGARGFLISGNETILEPYNQTQKLIGGNLARLNELISDNPNQKERAAQLENIINQRLSLLSQVIETRRTKTLEEVRVQFADGKGRELSDEIRQIIDRMQTEEKNLLAARNAELKNSLNYTYNMIYLTGFAGILILGFANLTIYREVKKRSHAEKELRNVNQNLESIVKDRTEEVFQKNEELKEQIKKRENTEFRHRIALEAGSLGTWLLDTKSNKAETDDRALTIFGLSPEEFSGDAEVIFGRIHRDDFPAVEENYLNSLKNHEYFIAEFRVLTDDSNIRWVHCVGQPQTDENGEVHNFIGNCRDITESKEFEFSIRQSENFVRSILNSLSAHIAVLDKEGNIVAVNEAWEKFARLNCDDEQIQSTGVGQNYLQICEAAQNYDSQTGLILENLRDILQGKKNGFVIEYPCHSPTKQQWFLLQVSAMQNETGGAVISHINITDRKKAEIQLLNSEEFSRNIFENSPDCVQILELDGSVNSVNKNGLTILEINDSADITGMFWVDFWKGDDNELAYQAIKSAQNGKTAHFEGFGQTAKGREKWWDVSVAPIFDLDGKPVRILSILRDISDRREIEREREKLLANEKAARKDAEIANRLRDEFLATVSHELRAPLNSILGWAKMIEKGGLDSQTHIKAVKTIVRNAEAQNRLIEDLLDVSRIISGKLRLEVINIRPILFVESALETIRPAAEAKGILLEIKEDSVVSHISGDPNRLQQVIWNLLSNAIKFTPPGGKVTVEIERINGYVEIRVKDTGVGIKKDFLPHVFDRFRQADASSIRKFGGLGLGLAIVRHITEMHGGTVRVSSDGENKGTTFTVSLPVINIPQTETPETVSHHKTENRELSTKLDLNGLLILVVDDEEDSRQLLVQTLTFYGATVITAKSAAEGLIELKDKNPDVLVSDIGMPEEDGYSFIRKIRKLTENHHRNITAIALTAYTRSQDRMRALSAGYQNHVSKPVEPDELATVIASLTGRLSS